jgi:hypothetical protein
MPHLASDASERARLLEKAVSRWENEGGAVVDGRADPSSKETSPDVSPISNAEFVQLQIRVIALENLVTVLLSASADQQLDLAREMAAYIAPRPGSTPHRLTVHAAARMLGLVQAAGHLRALCTAGAMGDTQADAGSTG